MAAISNHSAWSVQLKKNPERSQFIAATNFFFLELMPLNRFFTKFLFTSMVAGNHISENVTKCPSAADLAPGPQFFCDIGEESDLLEHEVMHSFPGWSAFSS